MSLKQTGVRLFTATALAALMLSGCSTMTGGNPAQTSQVVDALKAIASDPNCGHTDRLQGDIGGLGSGLHVFLERTCPARPLPDPSAIPKS